MKKNLFVKIKAFLVILFGFFASLSYGTDLEVEPYEIYFDYDHSSYAHDALSVSDADGDLIYASEWNSEYGGKISNPAYIKGQSNRWIVIRLKSDYTDTAHLLIKLSYQGGNTGIGTLCSRFVPNFNLAPGTNDTLMLRLTDGLPASVGKHTFTWKWEILAIPVDNPNYCAAWKTTTTSHDFYTLLAAPQAPMTQPWTNVLDYACDWASGQSTATTIAPKVTDGIYYHLGDTDGDIDYDWPIGRSFFSYNEDKRAFYLYSFFNCINTSNSVFVNCSDVANLFNIFSSALGLNSSSKRIENYQNDFHTNSIDAIGSYSWDTIIWQYHHYGWYNNTVNDPCLRVNENSPVLPSNMDQGTYNNYLIKPNYCYTDSTIAVGSIWWP